MEIGNPLRRRKKEADDSRKEDDVFGELDVDPDSDLPVHENFVNSRKIRKVRK